MTKLIRFLIGFCFFTVPLLFTLTNSELFEFPKIIFIYIITTLLLTCHLANFFNSHAPLFSSHRLNFPIILFLASQIISTFFSVDRHMSIFGYYSRFNGGLLSIICFFILFQIVAIYTDNLFSQKIINLSVLSSILVCVYAIGQHFGIDRHLWLQDVQARVFSTLGQPNWLAAYLCIIISFIFFRLNTNPSLFNYLLLIANFLSLIFTKSKSGLIAFTIPMVYFLISKIKSRQYKQFFGLSLLIILPLFIFTNPLKEILIPSKTNTPTIPTDLNINITPSSQIRQIVWLGAFNLWKKFPLFGTGVETFAISYYWVRPTSHNLTSEWDFIYNKAHNEYLNYAATTGTLGILAYLFLILASLIYLKKQPYLLIAYLTILITNSVGFSVVITSLFFFTLPALATDQTPNRFLLPSSRPYLSLILIPFSLYLLIYFVGYFLADKNYFLSIRFTDKYPAQALDKINYSLKLRPSEPDYLLQAADIQASLGQADLAVDYLIKAENISPAHPNYLKKSAQILFNLGHYQTAISLIKKVIGLCPTDAKSYYILAYFYQITKDIDQATLTFQQALDLKPNYDHAHMNLALIYYDQKNYTQALTHFQSAYNINPKNTDALEKIKEIEQILVHPPKSS